MSTILRFGTMRDFARASNYSPYYYKRTASGRALTVLGRMAHGQGKPALRCTDEFLTSVMRIAHSVGGGFIVDGLGKPVDEAIALGQLKEFVKLGVQGNCVYVIEFQADGRRHAIGDATMFHLGGAE